MTINLPTERITVTYISKSFTYKMAAKTSWRRYWRKLRHCHPMYEVTINDHATTWTLVSYWYAWKRSRGVKIRITQRRNIRQFHKTFFPRATSRLQWNFSPVHKIHKVNKRTTVCWDTATVNSYSSSSSQQRTNSSQQWQRNCPLDSAERIETSYNGNRGQNIKLQLCRTLINTEHFLSSTLCENFPPNSSVHCVNRQWVSQGQHSVLLRPPRLWPILWYPLQAYISTLCYKVSAETHRTTSAILRYFTYYYISHTR